MQSSEEAKTPSGVGEFSNLDAPAPAKQQDTTPTETSSRWRPILLACSHCVALLIGVSVTYFFLKQSPPTAPTYITRDNFLKIQPGWDYEDVKFLLGSSGQNTRSEMIGSVPGGKQKGFHVYSFSEPGRDWENKGWGPTIHVKFDPDMKVIGKSREGWPDQRDRGANESK